MASVVFISYMPNRKITMTTQKAGDVSIIVAGSGPIIIDWGDGTATETYTLSEYDEEHWQERDYSHTYTGTSARTITITGRHITHLACFDNQLTSLDVSGNARLETLICSVNQLTNLNVSGCRMLTEFNCVENQLTSLDVSSCRALTYLNCGHNPFTNLDVNNNKVLNV